MIGMRVLGALRLSKDQENSTSIEGQREAIEGWATNKGHTVVFAEPDTDVSGSISPLRRAGLGPRFRETKASDWDILAVHKVDRLGRSVLHQAQVKQWCKDHGKTLVFADGSADLSTRGGRLTANMLAVVGEDELEAIRDRCKGSRNRLAKAGRFAGGTPPFGYEKQCLCHGSPKCPSEKPTGYTLVQNPATTPVAREMADMAINGASNGMIARWLNSEGITTTRGNEWNDEVVRKVLLSPGLAGYAVSGGSRIHDEDGNPVRITDDPVLDEDAWRKLQAALYSRRQKNRRERVGGHMLLRVLYCWDCSDKQDKPRPMYGHVGQGRKKGFRINMPRAEKHVEDHIMTLGSERMVRRVVTPAVSHTAELAQKDAIIAEIEKQMMTGTLPVASGSRMLANLTTERDRLAALPQRDEKTDYEAMDETVADHWAALDREGRGRFLRTWGVQSFERRNGGYTRSPALTAALLAAMGRTKDDAELA